MGRPSIAHRRFTGVVAVVAAAVLVTGCGNNSEPIVPLPVGGATTAPAGGSTAPGTNATALPDDGAVPVAPASPMTSPSPAATPTGSPAATPTASPAATPTGSPAATPTASPGLTPDPPAPITPVHDGGQVGVNGPAMLRGDRSWLVVEIDVQEGVSVDQAALDHLVDELSRYVDKPGGIAFDGGNTFASERTEWTVGAVREAMAANRTVFSDDDQVAVHVLYLRGGHHSGGSETDAIGLSYSASTIAVFPQRWNSLTGLLGSGRAVERALLVHEFGHLFGLVNLTYTSDIDHEDPDHPGHSRNRDSVMYHAIETTLLRQVFSGPPPDRYDQADAADLEGLKSGRL